MELAHIVPRFRPQFDGLGDYARLLGDCLLANHEIESRYIVGDPAWASSVEVSRNHHVKPVSKRDRDCLVSLIGDAEIVVLHYVGYGYQSRGIPFWINDGIEKWKAGGVGRKLVVVFHELWASGPPWKSECYLGFVQRRLVAALYRMADLSIVSGPLAQQRLEAMGNRRVILHPVPSGISNRDGGDRGWSPPGSVTVALFGLLSQRRVSLRCHAKLLWALEQANVLRSVNVIGQGACDGADPSPDVAALRGMIPRNKIHILADATSEDVGRALAESDIMLSFYPSRWLGKSGSVMAALANGAVPILPEGKDLSFLKDGVELTVCSGERESINRLIDLVKSGGLSNMGRAGRRWYMREVDWPILAERLSRLLWGMRASLRDSEESEQIEMRNMGGRF